MTRTSLFFIFLFIIACKENNDDIRNQRINLAESAPMPETIKAIHLPEDYERMITEKNSFGEWLRSIRLKKDAPIYFSLKNHRLWRW